VFASPLARKLAAEAGFDISLIAGTGPGGRIVKADVNSYTPSAAPAAAATAATAAAPVYSGAFIDLPASEQQQHNAANLLLSKQTIPHYYLTVEMNVDKLLAVRGELNGGLAEEDALTVNDFIIKAASLAMKKVPEVNSAWMGSFTRQFSNVDAAITCSTGNGKERGRQRRLSVAGSGGASSEKRAGGVGGGHAR
jgi:pyruvate dehydrogenase E2 component (dihydrolipoamide acetyltransferase)